MHNIEEMRQWGYKRATQARPEDVDYVLAERLGLTPSEFLIHKDEELTPEQEKQAKLDLKKLARGMSPQYILGYAWFYGYKIQVKSGVLIPRFDTENLVKWALDNLHSGMKILDLGTGSGCITVALAKEAAKKGLTGLVFYASDVTDQALRVSEENFLNYGLDVYVRKANCLIGLEKFDLIISNPPYIKTGDKDKMDENVLRNEPKGALFAGADGLDFYREFVKQVPEHLNSHGSFYLEYGFDQQVDLKQLLESSLPDMDFEFKKDLAGKPRMVQGKWQK